MTTRTVFLIFDDGKTFKFVLKKKTPAVRLVQKVATTRGLDPGACSLERDGLAVADDEDVHSGGGADVHLRVIEPGAAPPPVPKAPEPAAAAPRRDAGRRRTGGGFGGFASGFFAKDAPKNPAAPKPKPTPKAKPSVEEKAPAPKPAPKAAPKPKASVGRVAAAVEEEAAPPWDASYGTAREREVLREELALGRGDAVARELAAWRRGDRAGLSKAAAMQAQMLDAYGVSVVDLEGGGSRLEDASAWAGLKRFYAVVGRPGRRPRRRAGGSWPRGRCPPPSAGTGGTARRSGRASRATCGARGTR